MHLHTWTRVDMYAHTHIQREKERRGYHLEIQWLVISLIYSLSWLGIWLSNSWPGLSLVDWSWFQVVQLLFLLDLALSSLGQGWLLTAAMEMQHQTFDHICIRRAFIFIVLLSCHWPERFVEEPVLNGAVETLHPDHGRMEGRAGTRITTRHPWAAECWPWKLSRGWGKLSRGEILPSLFGMSVDYSLCLYRMDSHFSPWSGL